MGRVERGGGGEYKGSITESTRGIDLDVEQLGVVNP